MRKNALLRRLFEKRDNYAVDLFYALTGAFMRK